MLQTKGVDEPNVGARPVLVKPSGRGPKPLNEIIVDGLVTVTPELSQRIIREANYEKQRPVRPLHVAALAQQMRRREWTAGTQIHFGRTPDGALYLVDGQHRLHAVIGADSAVRFQVLVTDVSNVVGLGALYRRHDRLAARRTVPDVLNAEGIGDEYDLRSEISNGCFAALLLISAGFRTAQRHADPYLTRSDEARLRLCLPFWPIANHYQDAIANAPANTPPLKRYLASAGPMAVGLLTLRDAETKADPFWRGVANNDRLSRDDPRAAYIRYLVSEKRRTSVHAAKAASLAWNAFYRDEQLSLIRVFDTPIEIAGVTMPKAKA